jgi:hypothetical protein
MTLAATGGGSAATTAQGLPWPEGDPGGLRAAARELHAAAAGMRDVASAVGAAGAGATGWHGVAATAFAHTVQTERSGIDQGAGALEQAVGALHRLASTVEDAQQAVRALDDEVRVAEEEAAQAQAASALAAATATAAQGLVDLAGSPGHPAPHGLVDAADDASALASRASSHAGAARSHADAVRQRAMRQAADHCQTVSSADQACAGAIDEATAAAPMGGLYPNPGDTPAQRFVATAYKHLSLDDWRQLAYFLAGIHHWDPSEGLAANDGNVQKVYKLYGDLWSHDHNLQWAGMANLVGPLFYAGWQDLDVVKNLTDAGDREKYLLKMMGVPELPGVVYAPADLAQYLSPIGGLSKLGSDEIDWYEKKFLDMQKQIFDDMAPSHVAYAMGGIGAIRNLSASGTLPLGRTEPFEDIASGDPQRVADGNLALLRREQQVVIQNDYDVMRSHDGPVGEAFTTALTFTANNPIPGGHSYLHDYHHDVEIPVTPPEIPFTGIDLPHVSVDTGLQIPDGNVADFEDRWKWISQDMVPHYQDLLQDPGQMQSIVNEPVAQRAHDWRMVPLPYHGGG